MSTKQAVKPMKPLNNTLQETYCSFEVSKLLKEKGFNVNTLTCYTLKEDLSFERIGEFSANNKSKFYLERPTHALAIEWIRVNFGIWVFPILHIETRKFLVNIDRIEPKFQWQLELFNSPQEATEAALLYTLQNLIP